MAKFQDLTGQIIHNWKVLDYCGDRYWLCKCNNNNCNITKKIHASSLKQGTATCACSRKKHAQLIDISGQRFGNWLVIEYMGNNQWKCECQCSNKTIQLISRQNLINGRTKSCGCKRIELRENTLFERYGDTAPNKAVDARESWQIDVLKDKDLLKHFIKTKFSSKPTFKEVAKTLGVQRHRISSLIHRYKLEELINIDPLVSEEEKHLLDIIKTLTNEDILHSCKDIIKPYELDIYIPNKKIAIEFNGNYWHSNEKLSRDYHFNKSKLCWDIGIRLIHIYEYELLNEKTLDNVIIIIKNALNYNEYDLNNLIITYTDNRIKVLNNNEIIQEIEYNIEGNMCTLYNIEIIDGVLDKNILSFVVNSLKNKVKNIQVRCNIDKQDIVTLLDIGFKPDLSSINIEDIKVDIHNNIMTDENSAKTLFYNISNAGVINLVL